MKTILKSVGLGTYFFFLHWDLDLEVAKHNVKNTGFWSQVDWHPNSSYVILAKLLDFLASVSSSDNVREFDVNICKIPKMQKLQKMQ